MKTSTTHSAKMRRFLPRFTLRALLVVVTLTAVWLAIQTNRARTQAEAVKKVQELGGVVGFDYEYDKDDRKITGAEPAAPRWLRNAIGEDYFRKVVAVDFTIAIHNMRNPSAIDFTARALAAIDDLPDLRILEFSDNPKIDDASLAHLAHLSRLRILYLYRTHVTGAGLSQLIGCRNLWYLHLDRTPLDDRGLVQISRLTNLRSLYLNNTKITDNGLTPLALLTSLDRLRVNYTDVSDSGLDRLAKITSLKDLDVFGTNVTSVGIRRIQQALPKCSVSPEPERLDRQPLDIPMWESDTKPSRAEVLAKIKELKGDVNVDATQPGVPIVGLRIFDSDISDASLLALLAEMPDLEFLNLRNMVVGNELAAGLERCPKLQRVSFQDTRIDDNGASFLTKLPQLTELDLQETRLSDRGLPPLQHMQNLRRLQLNNTRVSPAGVDELQKALPQCQISY
jgi:Leucine-rich repeat (LRR) protein